MTTTKISKTYTKFPKINKDISENKTFQNNNHLNLIGKDFLINALSGTKWVNKEPSKLTSFSLKSRKVLLTSPENITPNGIIRKYNNEYFLPYKLD